MPTGVVPAVRGDASDRAQRAWRLRVAGLPWRAVAEEVGYSSAPVAHRAVTRHLGRLPVVDREEQKRILRERVEVAWRYAEGEMRNGRSGAVRGAVAVLARMAQMDGLDEPTQLQVGRTPSDEEFNEVMRLAVLGRRAELGQLEGDPFADWAADSIAVTRG